MINFLRAEYVGIKEKILMVKHLGAAAVINVEKNMQTGHNASVHMLLQSIFVNANYKYKVIGSCNCALQTKL